MNRQEKAELVESLKQDFAGANAIFWIKYQGLTVVQLQALRVGLREQKGRLKVAKVRLVKRVVRDASADMSDLMPSLREQLAVVISNGEPNAVAKVLYNFAKENEAMRLVVGHFENKMIGKTEIEYLATLPSREVLLAQVCGALNASIAGLARVLNLMVEAKQ